MPSRTTKSLFAAAIAAIGASAADARILTYTNLTCRYSARLVNYDTVRSVTITNVGGGTVPSRACCRVSRGTNKQTVRLNRTLAPNQQATAPVGFNWPS